MPVPSSTPIIIVSGISHAYNSLEVLKDVSIIVNKGEFISIIGPSGCGKTTLLKIIGGLISPTTQKIINIKGSSIDLAVKKQDFGFVFQNNVLLPWRTVKENIQLPLEIIGASKPTVDIQSLINLMCLKGFEDYLPKDLSGGMAQRVAIARALVFNPDILLMDEPFNSLDEITRDKLNDELLRIWEKTKKTIIFITHSLSEAVYLSDRVILLSKRPGTIKLTKAVKLKIPRTEKIKQSPEFIKTVVWLKRKLYEA